MRRADDLRSIYLPKFERLAKQANYEPIAAACDRHYGCYKFSLPDPETWKPCMMGTLKGRPPVSFRVSIKTDTHLRSLYSQWIAIATEAAESFGTWMVPLGINETSLRPRGLHSWFAIFRDCKMNPSVFFASPCVTHRKTSDDELVERDATPVIWQPAQDVDRRPGICFATAELIVVDDLLTASQMAIRAICEAFERTDPSTFAAGPTTLTCSACEAMRECDPYFPPTHCFACGAKYGLPDVEGVNEASEIVFTYDERMSVNQLATLVVVKHTTVDSWSYLPDFPPRLNLKGRKIYSRNAFLIWCRGKGKELSKVGKQITQTRCEPMTEPMKPEVFRSFPT